MTFSFAFGEPGDESRGTLGLGLPLLGGEAAEALLGEASRAGGDGAFSLWRGPAGLAGWARACPGEDLEGVTMRLYGQILGRLQGLTLYRTWNCIPRINAAGPFGLENYRAFCKGRSLAFEAGMGPGFEKRLPASTAVGTAGAEMTVVFLAGDRPARYLENPAQVPAYEYPSEHGPRSPSFARAAVVEGAGTLDAFVSGTSAVRGHATVSPHDTAGQLDCTLENLRLVSRACGLGETLGAGRGERHFKVYLRNQADWACVALQMERRILTRGDRVSYLGAEICRSALNVEIEVTVRGAPRI
jgi:chorismate lyase / 3-hydroxybenzoate synthase